MEQHEVARVMLDIERSVKMRKDLCERLRRQEPVDLVQEWQVIEKLDLEIAKQIRKRRPE